jgi:hypothetical protein
MDGVKILRINWFILLSILISNTLILEWKIEIKLMIKLLFKLLKLLKPVKLESNVPRLLLIKLELKNLNLNKCGKVLMELLEIIWMEQYLDNQLLSKIFQDWLDLGINQLSLADMLL